jgi:hypothetical protein
MDNREKVNKGINAQQILNDPLIQEALRQLEGMYINDWKTSTVDDVVKRERAYACMSVLNDFIGALGSIVNTGKIAEKQIERDSKL